MSSSRAFCFVLSSVSEKNAVLEISFIFCICDTAYFLSDAGGIVAIFRDEVFVLNEADKS